MIKVGDKVKVLADNGYDRVGGVDGSPLAGKTGTVRFVDPYRQIYVPLEGVRDGYGSPPGEGWIFYENELEVI